MSEEKKGLELLRAPFPAHQISKLPKETRSQIEARKADRTTAVNCKLCGGWHHKSAIHLDYVGHAALTDRLLDADPEWSWEPMALRDGLPALDATGGLWIRLTVCGVTRIGYGNADDKGGNQSAGDRIKEVIGDAIRNAAMRSGAALGLWHKGDLHADDDSADNPNKKGEQQQAQPMAVVRISEEQEAVLLSLADEVGADMDGFRAYFNIASVADLPLSEYARAVRGLESKRGKKRP